MWVKHAAECIDEIKRSKWFSNSLIKIVSIRMVNGHTQEKKN